MSQKSLLFLLFTLSFVLTTSVKVPAQGEELEFNPSPYGIMGFPYSHSKPDPDVLQKAEEHMDLYLLSGSRWDRRDFWWSVVEPEPGQWEWDYFDEAIEDFKENKVNLVIILCYGSAWKGEAPQTEQEIKEYGEYVYRMVDRYKGYVKHWEIWNEPNILPFWAPKPDVAVYTKLLQEAYRRAKEADPDCVILGGGLAGAEEPFVRGMYENGAKGYFDAFSYHTYNNNPDEVSQTKEIRIIRDVMKEYNDLKPLWITETGIYTGPSGVTETVQAERVVKSSIRWVYMGIERIFQLTLKDWSDDLDTEDAMHFRGFANMAGTPKESFYSFRTMVDLLGERDVVGRVRLYEGLDGYVFDGESPILVTWTEEGKVIDHQLNLSSRSIMHYTMDGEKTLLASESGEFDLKINQSPVYLEGVGPAIIEAAKWEWNIDEESLSAGDTFTLGFNRKKTDSADGNAWEARIIDSDILEVLDSNENSAVVQVKNDVLPGKYFFTWRVLHKDDDQNFVDIYGLIDVQDPIVVSFAQPSRYDLGRPMVNMEIRNNSEEEFPLSFSGAWQGDGVVTVDGTVVAMSKRKATIPIKFPPAFFKNGKENLLNMEVVSGESTRSVDQEFKILKIWRMEDEPVIDGDLSEWASLQKNITMSMLTEEDFNPSHVKGEGDSKLEGWMTWDDDNLYLAFEYTDDALFFPSSNVIWNHDSLQLAFDGGNNALPEDPFGPDDYEIEVARLTDGSDLIYATQFPPGQISEIVESRSELAISVDEEGGTVKYEIRIPSSVLAAIDFKTGQVFGFNLVHNDNDGGGEYQREGWLELTPGIGYGKMPFHYYDAVFWPSLEE